MSSKAYLEIIKSLKRTYDVFRQDGYDTQNVITVLDDADRPASQQIRLASKIRDEYSSVVHMDPPESTASSSSTSSSKKPSIKRKDDPTIMPLPKPTKHAAAAVNSNSFVITDDNDDDDSIKENTISSELSSKLSSAEIAAGIPPKHILSQIQSGIPVTSSMTSSTAIIPVKNVTDNNLGSGSSGGSSASGVLTAWRPGMVASDVNKPQWHAPWKLKRVIVGHLGWVRCISVDTTNMWFATGSADRTIKIWDLASSELKVTLTGHISTVRGVAISARHPYLFSCGEDKTVKCWDLETNKVVRHYHGHLSGVYAIALHPTLDLLVTGGRDSSVRVWDMRTRANVHTLTGHTDTVMSVAAQAPDPQIVSGSMDKMVRLWDLAAGKCATTLTHHKKGVRAIALHQRDFGMVTGSADKIKKFSFPDGDFMCNFSGHQTIINSLAINNDDVVVSGGDNGSMYLWDWRTGYNFQQLQTIPQPGSLSSEAGIYAVAFDQTGTRLFTCEADKTIKEWVQDENATPETHPVKNWQKPRDRSRF